MRSIDWKYGLLAASLAVGGVTVFGCGGGSSSAPPSAAPVASAAPATSASAAPLASAAPAAAPAASESAAAPPAPAETSNEEEEAAAAGAELVDHHRHHPGGVAQFIAMSLDTLGVTPEERSKIESIQATLHTKLESTRTAGKKVTELLADGIAAGKIDKAKVDAAVSQLDGAAAGARPALLDALNQLHAALTAPERTALVDKVEAHWQVWQQANEPGPGAAEPHEHGRLESLATALQLTPEQVDKIRTGLRSAFASSRAHLDPEKVTARLDAFGTAFEGASFDAKTLKGTDLNAHLASWGATRAARFYEVALPVLTPEQRTKLAERVREHATHDETPTSGAKETKP